MGVQIEGTGNYSGHNSTDILVRTWADSIYRYDVERASVLTNGKGVYYLPAAVSFCEVYGCLANYDVTLSGFTKKGVYKGAAESGFTVEHYTSEDDYPSGGPAMTEDERKAAKSGEYYMVVKGDGEKLTGSLTTKVSVVPFKKGMYLYVKAGKSAWAEARVKHASRTCSTRALSRLSSSLAREAPSRRSTAAGSGLPVAA